MQDIPNIPTKKFDAVLKGVKISNNKEENTIIEHSKILRGQTECTQDS